jgi:homogentisate 1,2-dioxygenase
MKKIKQISKLLMIPALFAASVFGGDLRNEDGRRYEVKLHNSSTTTNTYIDANTTALMICSDCEIEVVGVGKIRIKGAERAVIKNGKLFKQ